MVHLLGFISAVLLAQQSHGYLTMSSQQQRPFRVKQRPFPAPMTTADPTPPLRYYASCASGLERCLASELLHSRVGASNVRVGSRGVEFDGSTAVGYRAVLWTRIGTKVLELLADARTGVETPQDLYNLAAEKVAWQTLLSPADTLSVDALLGQTGPDLRHSHFCALTVGHIKGAVVVV